MYYHLWCQKKRSMGVIMDEIDGMSSNDKGGLTELMNTIFTKGLVKKGGFTIYMYL